MALFVAGALVPIVNTGVFVLGCFTILDTIRAAGEHFEMIEAGADVIGFIFLGLAGTNFLIELTLSLALTPAVQRIITVVKKQLHHA